MKKIVIALFIAIILIGCDKEATQPISEQAISTSFSSSDTLGNLSTTFRMGKPFYLKFQMTNRTGSDQPFMCTGPISEIYISRNDTIISRQYEGMAWTQAIYRGILKTDSTLTNQWLGPLNIWSSMTALRPGTYMADVSIYVRFDNVGISRPQRIQITIIDTNQVVVKKPNIYLYPTSARMLSVTLEFPLGGSVIQSVPLYSNGWNISVEPSGKINKVYDYLFYESKNPDAYQYDSGWIVGSDKLESFFSNNLLQAGFNEREKDDFIEYWIPRLTDYPYYIVYPQVADDIGKVIRLKISESPDKMLRLFYVIKGTTETNHKLTVPTIPQFKRTGFFVTEWGVVIK